MLNPLPRMPSPPPRGQSRAAAAGAVKLISKPMGLGRHLQHEVRHRGGVNQHPRPWLTTRMACQRQAVVPTWTIHRARVPTLLDVRASDGYDD